VGFNIKSRFAFGEPWKFLDVFVFILVIKAVFLLLSLLTVSAHNQVVDWPMTAVTLFGGTLMWAGLVWGINWTIVWFKRKRKPPAGPTTISEDITNAPTKHDLEGRHQS